jgi:hypothetical protein
MQLTEVPYKHRKQHRPCVTARIKEGHSDHGLSFCKMTTQRIRAGMHRENVKVDFPSFKMAAAMRVRIGNITKNYVQALLLQSHTLKITQRVCFHKSPFLCSECCLC